MANKELLGASDIIIGSWENFKEHVALYTSFVVWFMALSVVQWLLLILTRTVIADSVFQVVVYTLATLPVSLAFALVGIGVVHLTSDALTNKNPDLKESFTASIHQLIPFIWVSFLTGLLIFFGLIFLIIPAAYFLITLSFATNFVIIDNVRGTAALTASRELVAGRWWAVMWRILTPGLFYYLAATFSLSLVYLVVGSMFGDPGLFFGEVSDYSRISNSHLLVTTVIPQMVNGLILPLFTGAHLILWYDLRAKQ